MEKANDAVRGSDRNWIMRAKRWRMESFLLCVKITLTVNLFLGEGWKLMLIGKKNPEHLSFYHGQTIAFRIGILPSDYQMYPCSSPCPNKTDSADHKSRF